MHRRLQVEIDGASWTDNHQTVPPRLAGAAGYRWVSVGEMLLHTALRTRPPMRSGYHLSDFWAWLRYLPAVSDQDGLALRLGWQELDPHQKTILSDDWGVGFTSGLIGELLDVRAWADTRHLANVAAPSIVNIIGTGKRGPNKSPDFIGVTAQLEVIVLESKGTQSNRDYLRRQMDGGVSQKASVQFTGFAADQSLVAGLYVPLEGGDEEALISVRDPPVLRRGPGPDGLREALAAAILRFEVGSFLQMMGFTELGWMLATGLGPEPSGGTDWYTELERQLVDHSRANESYLGAERAFALPVSQQDGVRARRAVVGRLMLARSLLQEMAKLGADAVFRERARSLGQRYPSVSSGNLLHEEPQKPGPERYAYEAPSGVRVEAEWL